MVTEGFHNRISFGVFIKLDRFNYFYPKQLIQLKGQAAVEKTYEARIITFILLSVLFTSFTFLILFLSLFNLPKIYPYSAALISTLSLCSIYIYKKHNKILAAQALLLFLQLGVINTFALITQSHAWSLLIWSYLLFLTSNKIIKFTIPFLGFLTNIITISYFCYYSAPLDEFQYKTIHFLGNILLPSVLYIILMTYKNIIDSDKYKQLKLQQQKDTISKMIITLSHEINNPLAIVKMCLTRLENERSQDLIERCDKNLERIIEINRLIKDLQDFDEVKYGETTTMYDIFKRIEIDRNGKFKRQEGDLLN